MTENNETKELLDALMLVRKKAQALARTKDTSKAGRMQVSVLVTIANHAIANAEMIEDNWGE